MEPPEPRVIDWVLAFKGGSGKNLFAKYLIYAGLAVQLSWDDLRDVLYIRMENAGQRVVFFDLTHVKPAKVDLAAF